jgi:dihydropteroate synthase
VAVTWLALALAEGAYDRSLKDGFGFGKQWQQNLELLHRLRELSVLGRAILVGLSRKKTIARVLGVNGPSPLEGTLATTALAIANGADIVRVHDVAANVRVARMTDAVVRTGAQAS